MGIDPASEGQSHSNSTRSWSTTSTFLVELCEWAAALPPEQLPPRQGDAARHFGRTTRTIGRWLGRAGIDGWDGFLRYWSIEMRQSNTHDDAR
jgi:hypothetical protein